MVASCTEPLYFVWEGAASDDHEPGDLPVHCTTQTYEDREVPAGFMTFYCVKRNLLTRTSPHQVEMFFIYSFRFGLALLHILNEKRRKLEEKQMKKWYSILLAMLMAVMVLGGCGQSAQPEKQQAEPGKEEQKSDFPVTVKDALDEEVVIEEKPEKIISLIPSNTEVVYALGNGEAIVGVTDFDNYPEEAMSKEKIGGIEFNIEKMISLKPDLVLAHESTADSVKDGLQQLKDAGIQVVVVNDAQSLDSVYESIEMIGKAIGEQEKATELVDDMKERFVKLEKQAESIKEDQKKSVFVEVSPAPEIYAAGKNTFINEMLELISAKNAIGDMEGWPKIDQEAIVERNPEVVVTTYGYYSEKPVEQVLGRQGWNNVKAVKDKQVFDVHSDLVTRSGPRLAEGAEELAKAIYPDVFK